MKFEKLVQLMEAGSSNAYYNAMNAEKPKGFSKSSPVFGNDSNELREQQDRWEWDSSQPLDTKGQMLQTKVWNNMLIAFGLLFNDSEFDLRVQELARTFDSKRDSISSQEEKDYNLSLNRIDDYNKKMTGVETKLNKFQTMRNYNNAPPSRKEEEVIKNGRLRADIQSRESFIKNSKHADEFSKLSKELESLRKELENVNAKIPNSRNPKQYDDQLNRLQKSIKELETKLSTNRTYKKLYLHDRQLKKLKDRLSISDDILSYMNYSDSEVGAIKNEMFDLQEELKELEKKYKKAVNKRDELAPHIDIVNQENEKLSEWAIRNFIGYVKSSAENLYNKLSTERGETEADPSLSNFEIVPEKLDTGLASLKALASDDENLNPIIGYINKFRQAYNNREYDTTKQLNPNINITAVRDYSRLPYVVMMKIYSSLRTNRKIISLDNLNTIRNEEAAQELLKVLRDMSRHTRSNYENWTNPQTKSYISQLIDLLPHNITQSKKNELKSMVNRNWTVINNKTNPTLMIEEIERALRKRYSESFDKTLAKFMKNVEFDEEEFQMDLIEVAGRCFSK